MAEKQIRIRSTFILRLALYLAALAIVAGMALVFVMIANRVDLAAILGMQILAAILGTLLIAVLLVVLARILKLLEQQARQNTQLIAAMEKMQATLAERPAARAVEMEKEASATEAAAGAGKVPEGYQLMPDIYPLLDALHEVRDILLLSEEQRATMRRQQEQARREQTLASIHTALDQGMWDLATLRMADLPANDPARTEIQNRIAALREEARKKAIGATREQLHHLMAITNWSRAEELTAELAAQFPDDAEVRELAATVKRERDAFAREQIAHLLAELKTASDNKDWRRAVLLADELVSRYPNEPAIQRLQADVPTLHENADAQERREEEALFKELLLGQRYDEALQVAQRVMNRFPGSPTAVELEKLLPKVRQLAEKK